MEMSISMLGYRRIFSASKGQIISEENCAVLKFPKKQRRVSALASKMRQIKKALYYTN